MVLKYFYYGIMAGILYFVIKKFLQKLFYENLIYYGYFDERYVPWTFMEESALCFTVLQRWSFKAFQDIMFGKYLSVKMLDFMGKH